MWFKNLQIYRLPKPFEIDPEQLDALLAKQAFRRCENTEPMTRGWAPPLGKPDAPLAHAAAGRLMVCLRTEEKILPASVVRQIAGERVAEIEENEARKLGAKRRREIRERVAEELLPRAFTRIRSTYAYIDPKGRWLIVDAASPKKADEIVEALIKSIDDFQPRFPQTKESPAFVMTEWLRTGDHPSGFTVDTDCELADERENGPKARFTRQNLDAEEVRAHIAAGMRAQKMALTWNDRISFVLTEQLQVRRLSFLDILQEQAEQDGGEGGEQQFDADFAIMGEELSRLIPDLLDALGGEDTDRI